MIGGIMLTLIEGVQAFATQYMMRQQQLMMEEQMAMQKKELERMLRKGGTDVWANDFNTEL